MARELRFALALVLALPAVIACKPQRAAAAPEAPAYKVAVAAPKSCAKAAVCEARVTLTAQGDYKVNEDYPHKFVADKGSARVESSFTRDGKRTGTLTIKIASDGTNGANAKVSGTFKFSVCTDEVCKIEEPKIAFAVPFGS